jgi:hypothetical protein
VHAPVHAVAVRMAGPAGARFIRSVLEPSASRRRLPGWVASYDTLTTRPRGDREPHRRAWPTPLISVVMPVYATAPKLLEAAIESVRASSIRTGSSASPTTPRRATAVWRLLQRTRRAIPRSRSCAASQRQHLRRHQLGAGAGDRRVRGADGPRRPPARARLYEVAALLQDHPDADLIYSDEDKIDDAGRRFEPYFKTDWNPS